MNREFLGIVLESSTLQIRSKLLQDNKKYQGKTRQHIEKDIQQTVKPFAQLQKLFSLLFKSIRSEISPLNLRQIGPQAFRNSSQHDTIEFGRAFLDLIFRNKLSNIFEGQVNTSIECQGCGKIRQRRQAFLDLHLPVDTGQLQDLIQNSFGDERVSGLTCDNCGLVSQQSIKRHQISKFPPYLLFSINRFEYDSIQKRVKKNKARIIASPIVELNGNKYGLYSLIVHTGPSPNAGHYFSFSRVGLESESKWVCHNDAQVSEFSGLSQVKSFLESSEEDTPYVLFYENIEYISNKKEQLSKSIQLRAPQEQFVRKDDENFVNSVRKTTFNLQPSNYIFFDKQQDEDRGNGGNGGGGGFYNSYIS